MALWDKPLEEVTEQDLQDLLGDDRARERRNVEYKLILPGATDAEKKEFLADVSSFARHGGHLIYGMRESGGVPIELCGVAVEDADKEARRLDQIVRSGIKPRLGITIHPMRLASGQYAFVMRIARSAAYPHAVTYQRELPFFARSSNGKYPMDIDELRGAFLLAETAVERIRAFRQERLKHVRDGDIPLKLEAGPKFALHLIPLAAFDLGTQVDLHLAAKHTGTRPSTTVRGTNLSWNLDGYLVWEPGSGTELPSAYVQTFRNGSIELVNAKMGVTSPPFPTKFPATSVEEELLQIMPNLFDIQSHLGCQPPVAVMLSLLGVKGLSVESPTSPISRRTEVIDRDELILPEVLLQSIEVSREDLETALHPLFDMMWNAAGYAGSVNYDQQGKRRQR